MTQSPQPLPANQAFVVQFRAPARGVQPDWEGRVEHLVSGQAALFHSQEELWTFMTRILTEVQTQRAPTGGGEALL